MTHSFKRIKGNNQNCKLGQRTKFSNLGNNPFDEIGLGLFEATTLKNF